MPFLPPPPTSTLAHEIASGTALPLVAADAFAPVDLVNGPSSGVNGPSSGVNGPSSGVDGPSSGEPEKKSNCVEGFVYKRWKMVLFTLSMVGKLLLFPLWPFFLAREAKDPSIAKNYFKTLGYCLKSALGYVRYGSIGRLVKYNVLHGPEYMKRRIAMRKGACSRCAKCCQSLDCLFLGQDKSGNFYCKVFGTTYWYYGTCGRYPIDQADIDDHGCPGFAFPKPVLSETRREERASGRDEGPDAAKKAA